MLLPNNISTLQGRLLVEPITSELISPKNPSVGDRPKQPDRLPLDLLGLKSVGHTSVYPKVLVVVPNPGSRVDIMIMCLSPAYPLCRHSQTHYPIADALPMIQSLSRTIAAFR